MYVRVPCTLSGSNVHTVGALILKLLKPGWPCDTEQPLHLPYSLLRTHSTVKSLTLDTHVTYSSFSDSQKLPHSSFFEPKHCSLPPAFQNVPLKLPLSFPTDHRQWQPTPYLTRCPLTTCTWREYNGKTRHPVYSLWLLPWFLRYCVHLLLVHDVSSRVVGSIAFVLCGFCLIFALLCPPTSCTWREFKGSG